LETEEVVLQLYFSETELMNDNNRSFNLGNTLVSLIIFAAVFLVIVWVAQGVFTILSWLAPIMLIITLLLDYKVVVNYLKTLWLWLRHKTLFGILAVIFTILGFPLVTAFLLFRAFLSRSKKRSRKEEERRQKGEFIEYEELDDTLELPDFQKEERLRNR
jgi:predicted membrane protein